MGNQSNHIEYPLTNSQKMLWTGMQLNPNEPVYNIIFRFDIHGNIDEERFQRSFRILVEKSDVLRTTFGENKDVPFQIIRADFSYQCPFIDLSQVENQYLHLEKLIEKQKAHQYDVSKCCFEVLLVKLSDNQYSFFFNLHHLINDAIGHFILFRKLGEIYSSLSKGETADKINVNSFRDFIEYEQSVEHSEKSGTYWKKKSTAIAPVKLYNRKAKLDTAAKRLYFELGKERTEKLYQVTKEGKYKSFNQDLAVFQVLSTTLMLYLHKVSGQSNVSFGSPVHNRVSSAFKETPGLFIEFFPLAVDFSDDESISSLYQKVVKESFQFLHHAKPGLSSPELNRKFNVLFNFVNASVESFCGHDVTSTYLFSGHNDPRHDLVVQVNDYDQTGNLKVQFDYKLNQLEDPIPEFMQDQFLLCLDAVLDESNKTIEDVSLVSEKESDFLIKQLNQTDKVWEEEGTLINLVDEQCKKNPQAIALVFEDQQITYEELERRSNSFANHLVSKGVQSNEIIGLAIHRSINSIVGILGILKAGAAYLPIDMNQPQSRVEFILVDSRCEKVLIDSKTDRSLFTSELALIDIDGVESNGSLVNLSSLEKVAYVIYTSGSTGNPKGVQIQHSAIRNRVLWMKHKYKWNKDNKLLHKTPYTFDISVWEIFWPLSVGGKIVIADYLGHMDPHYLQRMIKVHAISFVHFVPSMLSAFLETQDLKDMPSLQKIFCSGEKLTKKLAEKVLQNSNAGLVNLYGPTEASVEVTCWECNTDNKELDDIPIGYPLDNVRLYILDKKENLVPYGVTGSLFIGGPQLSKGYINNARLTHESFVTSRHEEGLVYDSGDLVHYGKNACIYYHGRADSQVKIRGYRIELSEIESVLHSFPELEEAVAIVDRHESDPLLMVFYTSKKEISKNEMMTRLGSRLPEYMMPGKLIRVEEFPVNHNGKTDLLKLLEFARADNDLESVVGFEKTTPKTDMEDYLFEIWREVLGDISLGVDDHFIDIGGNSLQAIKIVSRIRATLEIEIPMTFLFEYPTILEGANHLEETINKLMASDHE